MNKYIISNTNIRFGKPVIAGTRIAVEDVLGWLAAGMTIDEIISDFPELNKEQITACLEYKKQ
jgi:uncharacterized protein (DUF433 family)